MALILVFIPAMLTALGVVREKELGSITNFYATPLTRLEFLIGKQIPYLVVSLLNLALLVAINRWLFGVPLKGSAVALAVGGFFVYLSHYELRYIDFNGDQNTSCRYFRHNDYNDITDSAVFWVNYATFIIGWRFSLMGVLFPAGYFLDIAVGTFTKALSLRDLWLQCLALLGFFLAFTGLSLLLLKKQEV